jgi:hypothetical protein
VGSILAFGCGGSTWVGEAPDGTSKFVAVGTEGTVQTSPDGTKWTPQASGVSVNLSGIAAGRSIFVAVGANGTILTSPDGRSWTKQESPTTVDLSHVIFNGAFFVAVGGSWSSGAATVKSMDGTSWTKIESPSNHMFHGVAYGGGTLVASAHHLSDLQTPALFTSAVSSGSAGASGWSQRQGPDFHDSLTVGDDIMVVGYSSFSMSRDGVTWTQAQPSVGGHALASSGATFVIVGDLGTIYSSPNAAEWTRRAGMLDDKSLYGVTYGGSTFVAVGETGVIRTSADGMGWTTQAGSATKDLFDVAYGPGTLQR